MSTRAKVDTESHEKNHTHGDPVRIHAWIQMGVERRETVIEVPDDEFERFKEACKRERIAVADALEQDFVREWRMYQIGWGWSGAGTERDYSYFEGWSDGASLMVTRESSNPNTEHIRLDCPNCSSRSEGE